MKIALLCDYGMDDVVATLYLLKYADRFEQIDILPVGGNFPLSEVTANAKRILTHTENLTDNVRLVDTSAIEQPCERLTDIHGEDGIGCFLPAEENYKGEIIAFDKWLDGVNEDYTIVSLGPCTVTLEILKNKKVGPLILMCGNIAEPPNYNGYEFNHGIDPEAFSECVKYPHCSVTLDTCHNRYCDFFLIENKEEGRLWSAIERAKELSRERNEAFCSIYDLAAVVYLLEPERFISEVKTDPFGNKVNVLSYIDNKFLL